MATPANLHLRTGRDPREAIQTLDGLIRDGGNALANVTGTGIGPGAVPLAEAYSNWVDQVETQLVSMAIEPDIAVSLFTERYWRIRQLHVEPVAPYRLVQNEISQQTTWLTALRDDLQQRLNRAAAAEGIPVVIDTNVLLEFEPPQSINWPEVTGLESVRLVVPLRVIEELDLLKYERRRQTVAERARSAIRLLDAWIGASGGPAHVRPDTTIEALLESAPRHRPADGDEEVLGAVADLQLYTGDARLVTGDMGMRLRGQALGIPVVPMPVEYLRQGAAQ